MYDCHIIQIYMYYIVNLIMPCSPLILLLQPIILGDIICNHLLYGCFPMQRNFLLRCLTSFNPKLSLATSSRSQRYFFPVNTEQHLRMYSVHIFFHVHVHTCRTGLQVYTYKGIPLHVTMEDARQYHWIFHSLVSFF